MTFFILKYLLSSQRYLSFCVMQISKLMTSSEHHSSFVLKAFQISFISFLLHRHFNLKSPTDHLSSFRFSYDSTENHIRGLKTLGKKTETYGDILVPIIQKKLPNGIKRNLARQNGNKEWQLDNLHKAILNECEILAA